MLFAWANTTESTIYLTIAVVGTSLFIIRLLLMFLGGHHGDVPHGGMAHGGGGGGHGGGHGHGANTTTQHGDSGSSFNFFTLQGMLAFLMGFGWMGLAALNQWEVNSFIAATLATGFGLFMMLVSAALMYYAMGMEAMPVLDYRNAVGEIGQVYLNIPALGQGVGEVQIVIDGQQKVAKAKSVGAEIKSFTRVRVVAVEQDQTLTVEPA